MSVVVGVVIQPDTEWRRVEGAIKAACDEHVPPNLRPGFVFHAKDVFGGGKHRDKWPKDSRWKLLDAMLSIPKTFGLPICYGMIRRSNDGYTPLPT